MPVVADAQYTDQSVLAHRYEIIVVASLYVSFDCARRKKRQELVGRGTDGYRSTVVEQGMN